MKSYRLRTCYVNCAEHLLNSCNTDIVYGSKECTWTDDEWAKFLRQIKGFGYNNFQLWLPPTLAVPGKTRDEGLARVNRINRLCHENGISFNALIAVNTIGSEWYFACPNDANDRDKIFEFVNKYINTLKDCDIFTLFPGDPGGCNRNGCTHMTFIELSAELAWLIRSKLPEAQIEIGTWGTPFTGWGDDLLHVENWDGTFAMLTNPANFTPEIPCHIWNGSKERAKRAIADLLEKANIYPDDTIFSINAGFNPDCEPTEGYSGLELANALSKNYRITSWDYSASEGELICYPHWRISKFKRKRLLEMNATDYYGAICYTMTPKLSQLMLYASAQLMINPTADVDELAYSFGELVFGDGKIGTLMEAFEIVNGWGYEPRRKYTRQELFSAFTELIERLNAAEGFESKIEIFPSAEEYRKEILFHAENFLELIGENPDREKIKAKYRNRLLSIYENVPMATDERTKLASDRYANIDLEYFSQKI